MIALIRDLYEEGLNMAAGKETLSTRSDLTVCSMGAPKKSLGTVNYESEVR